MAEYRTLKGKVKSVNRQNSGFTLVEDPDTWLNYSKQGDAASVKRDAKRGDTVEVRVNETGWIQSLTIVESAAPPANNGQGGGSNSGGGDTWRSRDPKESLHIGRQVALKSAVELMGFMQTIEPTTEALNARLDLIELAATRFAKFVNLPYSQAVAGAPGGPAAAQQPQTPSGSSQSSGTGSASSQAQGDNVTQIVYCQRDGKPIKGVRFQDNTTWTAEELVNAGRELCGEALCSQHFFAERDDPEKKAARAAAVASAHGVQQGVTETSSATA